MRDIFIYSLILLLGCACRHRLIDSSDVKISFQVESEVRSAHNSKLYVKNENNTVFFFYSDSLDFENYYSARLERNRKSMHVVYNDVVCEKVSEREYSIHGKKITVECFKYDKPQVEDEEMEIYFNDKLGLLLTHSSIWLTSVVYETDSLSTLLIGKILNDTSFLSVP